MQADLGKAALRARFKSKRDGLCAEEKAVLDKALFERLFESAQWKSAAMVFTYIGTGSEPDTIQIVNRALLEGKTCAAPRVLSLKRREMAFIEITNETNYTLSRFGILEPEGKTVFPDGESLIIVPGLCFDGEGNRLGYGGGFYDAYLSRFPTVFTIGLAYPFQIVKALPAEEWDKKNNLIIKVE